MRRVVFRCPKINGLQPCGLSFVIACWGFVVGLGCNGRMRLSLASPLADVLSNAKLSNFTKIPNFSCRTLKEHHPLSHHLRCVQKAAVNIYLSDFFTMVLPPFSEC